MSARRAYLALSLALMLFGAVQATNDPWNGDFWEHAAVIRELAAHPLHPAHPLLDLPAPHPLFTPYHLALALIVRATGIAPYRLLGMAGVLILGLVALAIWLFARWWARSVAAAPFLLAFSLLLWGHEPWRWSGFLHVGIIGRTAAYPSILGLALAILALAFAARYLETGLARFAAATGALAGAVILIHPFSTGVLWAGTAALIWRALRDAPRRGFAVAGAVALGTLAATAWPYYSLLGLIRESGSAYDAQQRPVYERFVERTLPILFAVPLFVQRLRRDHRDPTALAGSGLSVLIAFGFVSGRYSIGRTLPGTIFMAHTALADWTANRAVPWLVAAFGRSRLRAASLSAGVLVLASAIAVNFAETWPLCVPGHAHPLAPYAFLARNVGAQEVVLADLKTSAMVPVVAGRVVAVNNALPFVADAGARREDVTAFFETGTSDEERDRILTRYHVRWVLLNHSGQTGESALEPWLRARGRAIYEDSRFILIDVGEVS